MKAFYCTQKPFRLKSSDRIKDCYTFGNKLHARDIMLFYRIVPSNNQPNGLSAFAVPKRLYKRAVDRNLIKRRMRSAFTQQTIDLKNLQPEHYLCLMWVIKTGSKPSFEHLRLQMHEILAQLNSYLKSH